MRTVLSSFPSLSAVLENGRRRITPVSIIGSAFGEIEDFARWKDKTGGASLFLSLALINSEKSSRCKMIRRRLAEAIASPKRRCTDLWKDWGLYFNTSR